MRELLYKTMFILSLVSAFAVMLYGTGGPTMPFNPQTPVFNNPFAAKTVILYPMMDGSQAPVNIRGYVETGSPPTFISNPNPPIGCTFGEPIINTSDKSTGEWYGCIGQADEEGSYFTLGFSTGPNDWYTVSTILDSVPNNGRSTVITNITIDYQCHGNGDYPIFAFMPPVNTSSGAPLITSLFNLFTDTPFISPIFYFLNQLGFLPEENPGITPNLTDLQERLDASWLLPFLNGQPFGGGTGGILNTSTVFLAVSNPYGVCETSGESNQGPYSSFKAYAFGQGTNDLTFAGMNLNDFFGGSGANLLIYPGLGPGSTSDLIQMSYVSVTISYLTDAGCSYIATGDIFTDIPHAIGYVGCMIQALGYIALTFIEGSVNFFLYLVDWGSFLIQTFGNFLSVLTWLYGIPGLPSIIQVFVSAIVTLWIAIISIEVYRTINPFGE